ncbi:PulJ/GspJ family protein [Mesotoga sp. H07.pep.5.3]|uniref:PulJ/GspJ family protein n=1 Tax=Mesotoga sp. H07.pep.5.3 TaxID=1421003 RepID=UPI000C1763AB|nr:prepilin-type N-terminal cleavage/methylation domain-containing protein [Mesotoga sp. H07.pep.5.3]PIJ61589.1 hypothetical protein V513_08340 [Mesotoga sp. H07.pep.5.3]
MSLFRMIRLKKGMYKGLTMVEMMVTLLLMVVIMGILYIVLSSTFKISGQVQTQLAIDEEIMKLNSNMKNIISKNWTALVFGGDEATSTVITLFSYFPILTSTTVATISYVEDRVVFEYYTSETDITTSTLAENVSSFIFSRSPESVSQTQYIYYDAEFTVNGTSRTMNGAVRFY